MQKISTNQRSIYPCLRQLVAKLKCRQTGRGLPANFAIQCQPTLTLLSLNGADSERRDTDEQAPPKTLT